MGPVGAEGPRPTGANAPPAIAAAEGAMMFSKTLLLVPVAGMFFACDSSGTNDADTRDTVGRPIELVGTWTSEFGDETITESAWNGFCQQRIARFSNDDNVAILETLGPGECGTGFGRVVWKDVADDAFYYCTTIFGQASIEAAEAAPDATTNDLAAGCGGFAWSHLTRR